MSSSNEIYEQAANIIRQAVQHGLCDLGNDCSPQTEDVYTHLETRDGVRYQFIEPMSSRQLYLAAELRNHLVVKVSLGNHPMSPENLFRTARVIYFYDRMTHTATFGTETDGFTRPWIDTQNQKYWLVAGLEDSPK